MLENNVQVKSGKDYHAFNNFLYKHMNSDTFQILESIYARRSCFFGATKFKNSNKIDLQIHEILHMLYIYITVKYRRLWLFSTNTLFW